MWPFIVHNVGRSVGRSVRNHFACYSFLRYFFTTIGHYCLCLIARDCSGVYPALFFPVPEYLTPLYFRRSQGQLLIINLRQGHLIQFEKMASYDKFRLSWSRSWSWSNMVVEMRSCQHRPQARPSSLFFSIQDSQFSIIRLQTIRHIIGKIQSTVRICIQILFCRLDGKSFC